MHSKKKDYCIYDTCFFINLMVTTHKNPKTETHNLRKEERGKCLLAWGKIWRRRVGECWFFNLFGCGENTF